MVLTLWKHTVFGCEGQDGPNQLSACSEKDAVRSEQGDREHAGRVRQKGVCSYTICSTTKTQCHQSGMSDGHSGVALPYPVAGSRRGPLQARGGIKSGSCQCRVSWEGSPSHTWVKTETRAWYDGMAAWPLQSCPVPGVPQSPSTSRDSLLSQLPIHTSAWDSHMREDAMDLTLLPRPELGQVHWPSPRP